LRVSAERLQGPPLSRNGIDVTTVPKNGRRTTNAGRTPDRPLPSSIVR
jgi:hypothetical protein